MSNKQADVAVMDQYLRADTAPAMERPRTALAHVAPAVRHASESGAGDDGNPARHTADGALSLEEKPVTGLLTLRAGAHRESLATALSATLGLVLPERLSSESAGNEVCVRWMSPDEWLLSCPLQDAFDLECRLRSAIDGHIAIVNVSGGYSILNLSGSAAQNVLKKSTAYDVHPDNFMPGKVVNTLMAKAQVVLRCVESDRYEIIVRRSFADYLWLWLQRAGREHDLR
ncbi:MAG: sarcosine oxidase subunit gamma [Granulosicoccus sp.]|nr:sarcosine oxidase subunit gamma [Granulosicoccus sp.]